MQPVDLAQMDPRIFFVSALPPETGNASPIQGFSEERLNLGWAFDCMLQVPASYYQLLGSWDVTRGLRACGMLVWRHVPTRIDRLFSVNPTPVQPLWVIFSADREVADLVRQWQEFQRIKPLHVSSTGVEGSIAPNKFDLRRLRKHCMSIGVQKWV